MITRTALLALPLAAIAVAALAPAPSKTNPLAPFVSFIGPTSAVETREITRITTQDDWSALWQRHTGKAEATVNLGRPIIPEIDFSRCTVLAVFHGKSKNSNGNEVVEVERKGDRVVVRYDSRSYQTASFDGPDHGVDCTPYGIFILPRHEQPLIVEENTQNLIGKPPVWTERARFDSLPPQR